MDLLSVSSHSVSTITPKISPKISKNSSAKIIQKCWRSHVDRQIFKFYKDLIGFHTDKLADNLLKNEIKKEDKSSLVTATSKQCAATILKLISPKEAQLMDAAAGTHIRFRLASPLGQVNQKFGNFPPAVYYKIYTHRPIIDLCATAPRDYTLAPNKVILPKLKFNIDLTNENKSTLLKSLNTPNSGWYKRWENNPWRPVSDVILLSSLRTTVDFTRLNNFKPTVQQRRLKRVKYRKNRRIEWLNKMMSRKNENVNNTPNIELKSEINQTVKNLYQISQINNKKDPNPWDFINTIDEDIEDADVQALIDWTDGLDYDEYSNYWSHLGTAGFPSIEILGEKKKKKIEPQYVSLTGNKFEILGKLRQQDLLKSGIMSTANTEFSRVSENDNFTKNEQGNVSFDRGNDKQLNTSFHEYYSENKGGLKPGLEMSKNLNVSLTFHDEQDNVLNEDEDDFWTLDKLEKMSRPVSGRISALRQ